MKFMKLTISLFVSFFAFSSLAGTLVINNNQSDPRAKEVMYAYIDAFDKAHPEVTVVVNDFDN
jgi:ABC-type glycerol-3-phosphate transport system substrate-binding protein